MSKTASAREPHSKHPFAGRLLTKALLWTGTGENPAAGGCLDRPRTPRLGGQRPGQLLTSVVRWGRVNSFTAGGEQLSPLLPTPFPLPSPSPCPRSSSGPCPFQLLGPTVLLLHGGCLIKVYYIKNTSPGLRHSGLGPVWPPPPGSGTTQNAGKRQRRGRQLGLWPSRPRWQTPVRPQRPFKCLVSGRGCWRSMAARHSSRMTVPAGSSASARHGPGARCRQGTSADVRAWARRGARGPGHLPYMLFLTLPFLERAPRPKAPCCSSWARRRLRAESCLRPPRCRKRNFWARRRRFRICCLVLSSERTRPAGPAGVRGWDAPAGTGIQGAQPPGWLPAPPLPGASRPPLGGPHSRAVLTAVAPGSGTS